MTPLRVMVVDDSVVVRRLVTDVLAEDSEIEVVATAANGRIALDKLATIAVDAITLDIEMPEMNGIETLRGVRQRYPRLPVIMFSTLTECGATATLDALAAGASDFVTKPANVGSVTLGMQAVREQLIPRLKVLCGRSPFTASTARPAVLPGRQVAALPGRPTRVSVVVLGVSTGGPNALSAIWPHLGGLGVPLLVVQHMPPVFTAMLAQRLDGLGSTPVTEATDGDALVAGRALIAPGDHHMVVERSRGGARVRINQDAPEHSCRPAVDPLFCSAAAAFGPGTLAVVLTGMGSDGTTGADHVNAAGGVVLVQDEASSVVWGMPGSVANAGLAHDVVPLDRMAAAIRTHVEAGSPRSAALAPLRSAGTR